MINNNEFDRVEMAKEIAEVRKTGLTNMFYIDNVIEILSDLGHNYTVDYLLENESDYMNLLQLSGNY